MPLRSNSTGPFFVSTSPRWSIGTTTSALRLPAASSAITPTRPAESPSKPRPFVSRSAAAATRARWSDESARSARACRSVFGGWDPRVPPASMSSTTRAKSMSRSACRRVTERSAAQYVSQRRGR